MRALSRLSVVVPVGPDDTLPPALRAQLSALPAQAQVCVVCAEAAQADAIGVFLRGQPGPRWRCVLASPGRATQQNAGARQATREWLWFVHADAALAPATLPALAQVIDAGIEALAYFD
ncbi:MAG TPA: glycosyltransferase, partial [Pseudoxanthomonas sp.]|nr:glycosyltransferase [Pseudoxanthomonas sp.]